MTKGDRKELKKQLAATVIPILRQKGFKGSFPHFRRQQEGKINLITFQFSLTGGAFVIELANAPAEVLYTSWGKKLEVSKLTAHDVSSRKRLQSASSRLKKIDSSWFHYEDCKTASDYLKVSEDVHSTMEAMDDYWLHGEFSGFS